MPPRTSTSIAVALHPTGVDEVEAIAEGIALGAYHYDAYKSKKKGKGAKKPDPHADHRDDPERVRPPDDRDQGRRARSHRHRGGQHRPRLGQHPSRRPATRAHSPRPSPRTPAPTSGSRSGTRSDSPRSAAAASSVSARAQTSPPRLVTLTYAPANAVAHLALVGKGITFDSGGLSIKSGTGMATMKLDMAGAAAVVAATVAIAKLGSADQGHDVRLPRREHAERIGDPSRRRADDAQRQHGRGAQHRRRGSTRPGRRSGAGRRGQARSHRRCRDADRRLRRRARRAYERRARQRLRLRQARPRHRPRMPASRCGRCRSPRR